MTQSRHSLSRWHQGGGTDGVAIFAEAPYKPLSYPGEGSRTGSREAPITMSGIIFRVDLSHPSRSYAGERTRARRADL